MGRLARYILAAMGTLLLFLTLTDMQQKVTSAQAACTDRTFTIQQESHPLQDTVVHLLSDRFAVMPQAGAEAGHHPSTQLKDKCIALLAGYCQKQTHHSAMHPARRMQKHIGCPHAIDYYIYGLERILI